jgi:hypothetical protein
MTLPTVAHRDPLPAPPAGTPRAFSISTANAEAVTGISWRFWRDSFPHLVRRIGERKALILLADLEAALAGRSPIEAIRAAEDDPVEATCREFGLIDNPNR